VVRGGLATLARTLALAACGDGGGGGPGAVDIDEVSTAETRARIEAAIEETAGVTAQVDCPESVDADARAGIVVRRDGTLQLGGA